MTVEEFLSSRSPDVQALALRTREMVRGALPDATESVHPGQNNIQYGPTGKMADQFCYIAPFNSHVNLGFFRGTDLPDPNGLLEGTGKMLRHVKIKTPEDINKPGLRDLVVAAAKR
jgi:hypothetical protein